MQEKKRKEIYIKSIDISRKALKLAQDIHYPNDPSEITEEHLAVVGHERNKLTQELRKELAQEYEISLDQLK